MGTLLLIVGIVILLFIGGVFFILYIPELFPDKSGGNSARKLTEDEMERYKVFSSKDEALQFFIEKRNIQASRIYKSNKSLYVWINDKINENMWYIEFNSQFINNVKKYQKVPYKDIVEAELFEDGQSIIQTSKRSQLGRVIVGGVLANGVGAIIGGLSAKQTKRKEVKKIELMITLDDLNTPLIRAVIEDYSDDYQSSISETSKEYREKHNEALHWLKLMEVIMKRNASGFNELNSSEKQVTTEKISDTLTSLYKQGILTEEECKKKLVSQLVFVLNQRQETHRQLPEQISNDNDGLLILGKLYADGLISKEEFMEEKEKLQSIS